MMESLRNFLTGPRLIIVVLVCALPFVFLGTSSLTTAFENSYGTINGENISETDFSVASNRAVQRFKGLYGDDVDFSSLDNNIQLEFIKQELVILKTLQSNAKSLGFSNIVSEREAKKNIIKDPQFQIDGVFNEGVFEAQVNSNGFTKESYIELMTDLYASEIFRRSISDNDFVTKQEINDFANTLEKKSDINFLKISLEGLKNEIVNTLDELQEFYQNNQFLFFSDEMRSFKYIEINQDDYVDKVEIPEGFLESSYEQYLSDNQNNAQIRFAHIMIEKNNYETNELAFDSIKNVENLLADGNNFSDLASEFSEDFVTKDIGGDLDYFEEGIFPVEFEDVLRKLELDQTSNIIELEDTLHILKVTEINTIEPLSKEDFIANTKAELTETESFALMKDDYDLIEQLLFENVQIEEIAEVFSQEILISEEYSQNNYDFDNSNTEIKNYIFSPETALNNPYLFESSDKLLVISVDEIMESKLQNFSEVADSVSTLLTDNKAKEKINLIGQEIISIYDASEREKFIGTYKYITSDSFIDIKRFSSLIPQDVLNAIFKSTEGSELNIESSSGDRYIVNVMSFNDPSEDELLNVYSQYELFGKETMNYKMSDIINEDLFRKASVNLNEIIFNTN
ncbi:MAG: SurA N-terminal domain-containing protein [Gammaproteobacteria bacterium]